jgi:hypothetical protein
VTCAAANKFPLVVSNEHYDTYGAPGGLPAQGPEGVARAEQEWNKSAQKLLYQAKGD